MLKYSLAAAALIASGTLAIAEPQDKGNAGGAMPGAEMKHAPGGNAGNPAGRAAGKSLSSPDNKTAPGRNAGGEMTPRPEKGADALSKSNAGERGSKQAEGQKMDRSQRSAQDEKPATGSKSAYRHEDRKTGGDKMGADSSKSGSSTGASEGTEGRSGPRGSVASITSEQRSKVGTVFLRHHVEPARNLNVSINVGVPLPRSVRVYPVPVDIVEIVPEYRGYDYILLEDNRVAIVDPATFEIVDIIVVA